MKPIISVEGLGKSYTIRHEGETRYKSLREELLRLPKRLFSKDGQSQEEFWALKDVNFEIMPGDRVGIIGRNGAGKSTLLKLLSRITEPTTGRITLRGRVASLLEVGTGFHPELTGRENIFLNGAILGMSRAEVRRKFDEIVDFAGVEKFLDTPVKRYSSGMYVRLAFAVAAHLEPEVLVVDEVLAVGDAEFQKKCLGKMEDAGKEGRTVLFVSHNVGAIQQLCSRGMVINNGNLYNAISVSDAVNMYLKNYMASSSLSEIKRKGNAKSQLTDVDFYSVKDGKRVEASMGLPLHIVLKYSNIEYIKRVSMNVDVRIYDFNNNTALWVSNSLYPDEELSDVFHFVLPKCNIISGEYLMNIYAHGKEGVVDWIYSGYPAKINYGYVYSSGLSPTPSQTIVCTDFYMEKI